MSAKRRKQSAKKKRGKLILLIGELFLLCIVGIALWAVLKTTDKEQGVKKYVIPEEEIEVNSEIKEKFKNDANLSKYTTLALFGVDSRSGSLASKTRTDTIMIAAINNETGEVRLCSVYRDTYLNVGNDSYNKCNSAYAKGGAEQAINMLNMNLDLYITDFITVGFEGVIDTVDAVGGVDINVTDAEIKHLNNYQASMWCTEDNPNNLTTNYTPVNASGMQTLNGMQALAYCRIRYTAGSDFKRTERQRTVLEQILNKSKGTSYSNLATAIQKVSSKIATSLDIDDILELASNVSQYTITDTSGFPFTDHITTGKIGGKGDCVVPVNLEDNVVLLHEFLYPGADYSVSEDVKTYSQKIKSDTSPYLKVSATPAAEGEAVTE